MDKPTHKELSHAEERDIQLLEGLRESLADLIGEADSTAERIRAICVDHPDWNNEVAYTLDDAVRKVGIALAAITNWRRDVTEGDGE